ncbi:MAG TPA: hypothetical protein VNP02_10655, partial [Gammaproteobacteria bacterium]|nr:hypothetical protein [Gammaproteobacteria bacterium]
MLIKNILLVSIIALACSACAGLQSKPGVYEITRDSIKAGPRRVPLIYAKPATVKHPDYLVVFATGDGG